MLRGLAQEGVASQHSVGTLAVPDSQEPSEETLGSRCPGFFRCAGCPKCWSAYESVREGQSVCDVCGVEFGAYSGQFDQITGNEMSCNCDFDDC